MKQAHKPALRLVRPSSAGFEESLPARIKDLESRGFQVLYDELPADSSWPFTSSSIENRRRSLASALLEQESVAVICGRGGYGASDVISDMPWELLKKSPKKWVVGFSDISAIHSALFAMLGWTGIHGSMPLTNFWGEKDNQQDVEQMLAIASNRTKTGSLALKSSWNCLSDDLPLTGWLFGGCLSVLTNLIGTPFFPQSLKGAVVFLEDTGENPGQVMRALNQWRQSGALAGVRAIILGQFLDLNFPVEALGIELAKRIPIPVFHSEEFGHGKPNRPLVIGANATIQNQKLTWNVEETPLWS